MLVVFFAARDAFRHSHSAYRAWDISAEAVKGVPFMKIVVVKSPKMFAGLLRAVFGIKRSEVS